MAMRAHERDLLTDAVVGALAGAAAVWVMDRVDWFAFEHEHPSARRRTQSVRPGGMDPAHVVADKLADRSGRDLRPRDHNPAGLMVHYSIGVLPGALYAVLRRHFPALTAGHGSAFGLALFLIQDEGLNAVAGIAARPDRYPWQAHARGFAAHAIYGYVLETALTMADAARESREDRARRRL